MTTTPARADDELQAADVLARWGIPLVLFAFQMAFVQGYGYFRDELYYLASTEHLGFGFVEHPPVVVIVAWLIRHTLGDALWAIRLLPAVAGAATVGLTAAIARQMGGGRFAQRTAALAAACAPVYVAVTSVFTMNAFDVLCWAGCWWIVARLLRTGDERWWVAFGLLAGLGLENKISVLFLGFGVAAGLVLTWRLASLGSRWLWLGAGTAAAMLLPFVVWNAAHGWPTLAFMRNALRDKNTVYSPLAFMREQAIGMNPFAAPLWIAGAVWLLAAPPASRFRLLGWAYPAIVAVMFSTNAKPEYLSPAYTLLFAAGGAALDRATATLPPWLMRMCRTAAVAVVLAGGVMSVPLVKAVLSEDGLVRYAAALGIPPQTNERQTLGRLPQFFADMHGWPELAADVAQVYTALPPADRDRACIFAQNYGEAGAIDILGAPLGLPRALAGHNSYFLWGPRGCTGDVMIVIGDNRAGLEQAFTRVDLALTHTCRDCMPYENNRPIWIVRGPRRPLADLWPGTKKFI